MTKSGGGAKRSIISARKKAYAIGNSRRLNGCVAIRIVRYAATSVVAN